MRAKEEAERLGDRIALLMNGRNRLLFLLCPYSYLRLSVLILANSSAWSSRAGYFTMPAKVFTTLTTSLTRSVGMKKTSWTLPSLMPAPIAIGVLAVI